jgi:chemotaxis protein MotB
MSSDLGQPSAKENSEEGSEDLPFVHKMRRRGGSPPQGEDQAQTKINAVFQKIQREIRLNTEIQQLLGKVEVKMDPDGITIEIMDTEKTSMFAPGSARILPKAEEAFSSLVQLLNPLPNPVEVIGHTDATPFSTIPNGMTNWELSSARANEARKVLEGHGFDSKRVTAVIGKADKELRFPDKPTAPSNRRITVRLKFNEGKKIEDPSDGIEQMEQSNQQEAVSPTPDSTETPGSTQTPTISPEDELERPTPTGEPKKPAVKEYKSRTVTIKGPKMQEEPRKSSAIFKTTKKRLSGSEATPTDPYPVLKPGSLADEAFDPS